MRNFFQRLLVTLNFKRTENIADLILPFIKKGERILDLGAGNSKIARYIKMKGGARVIPLDVTDRFNETELEFKVYAGGKIPFESNLFDSVLLIFVLHHAQNPEETLSEAVRVSQNKVVIFEDIFRNKLELLLTQIWDILVNSLIGGEKGVLNFKSDRDWKKLFKNLGLKIISEQEVRLPFFRPTKQKLYVLEKA